MYKQNRKTMKNLLTLTFIFSLFLGFHSVQAEVIIVNNNTGQPGDYVKLQDAIDAAEPNDVLYVVGSKDYYDDYSTYIRVNKPLTIIGPGYFLSQNDAINTQASNTTAKVSRIYIGAGADGTVITGLDMDVSNSFNELRIGNLNRDGKSNGSKPEGITIVRNKINQIKVWGAIGTIIQENYISTSQNPVILYEESANTFINNNIIISTNGYANIWGYDNVGLNGTVIKNNTFNAGFYRIHEVDDIYNNIFISGSLNDCHNNTLKNNVFVTSEEGFLTGTSPGNNTYEGHNNEFGVAVATLFMEAEPSLDRDYQLAESSPAKGKGIDGVDAGAFSGDDNSYKISGLPAFPAIYELTTSGEGNADNGMKVTIKAKSHN